MPTPCEYISSQIGELFACSQINRYVRIRTPFLYPDGDIVDLYWDEENGNITITDLGEALGWLSTQTASVKRTPKQKQLIQDICLNHGIEFYRGMLMLRIKPGNNIADDITRLSQAILRVSDLWFTLRHRAMQTITDEVAEFLDDRSIQYERNKKVPGHSENLWRIDFHTRTPQKSSLVNVLSSGSKDAGHRLVEHTFTLWSDLGLMKVGPEAFQFISLFDDTVDVWTEEDLRLISDLSEIVFWSRPDEFAEKLAA